MDKKIKQVIVIRKDLNMRKGKMIAQGSHASMKVILDQMVDIWNGEDDISKELYTEKGSPLDLWLSGLFTKVVVYVNSEDELMRVYGDALEKNILCSLIEDAGLTEFNGVPTKTCCAIGPDYEDKIDGITGDLKLL